MKITLFTIRVTEMQKSIEFYESILKMKIVRKLNPNENMQLIFLRGEGEVMVELIENRSIVKLDKVSSNVSIGLFIDDMDKILELLKSQKILIKRGPITVPNGNRLLFIEDPNGVEIEFIEGRI